jgi:hypothetical protein
MSGRKMSLKKANKIYDHMMELEESKKLKLKKMEEEIKIREMEEYLAKYKMSKA